MKPGDVFVFPEAGLHDRVAMVWIKIIAVDDENDKIVAKWSSSTTRSTHTRLELGLLIHSLKGVPAESQRIASLCKLPEDVRRRFGLLPRAVG
jgi:hypothetical protein